MLVRFYVWRYHMWDAFFSAIGLLLVFEGVMPFVRPDRFRQYLTALLSLDNRTLRRGGLVSMVVGAGMIYLVRQGM